MINKRWTLILCVLFLMLAVIGCQARSPQVVKVGLVAPFEGEQRDLGYDGIYAARLAVREFNQLQQQNGSDIRLSLIHI